MPAAYQLEQARSRGFCTSCCMRPARPGRKSCAHCRLKSSIYGLFRTRRKTSTQGLNSLVKGYDKTWVQQVLDTFDGRCDYTGKPIEIDGKETARVVLDIPRSYVPIHGQSKIHHPSNVKWCHRDFVEYKRGMTGTEFKDLWIFINDGK